MHTLFPGFADDSELTIVGGPPRAPTEDPSLNTHFYDALVEERVVAVGCGHDHINDFCALRAHQGPARQLVDGQSIMSGDVDLEQEPGSWLCKGGGSGFGA